MPAFAVEGASLDGREVGLRVGADGLIAEIGPGVGGAPGDQVIHGAGLAVLPGFVNGHTHAAMTLFRGYADDLPLMDWLENHIWPAEAKLDAEDVYWGTRLACAAMIRTGTIRFWDMYWQAGAAGRAVADAGIRATLGPPLIDAGSSDGLAKVKDDIAAGLEEVASVGSDLVQPSLAPHAIYTVSNASLEWIAGEA